MVFDLTDRLRSEILFAMEDQNDVKVVDAANGILVDGQSCKVDDDFFYALPEWNSSDGFGLLEDFTEGLRVPMARSELKMVLASGRGVFRSFKNVIKAYPEVERKWHLFKNERMNGRLNEWYNTLRETWGLEKLENDETEDVEELLLDDFMFSSYSFEKDWQEVLNAEDNVKKECVFQYDKDLGEALGQLWQKLADFDLPDNKDGFICRTQSDEFTGCLLFSHFSPSAKRSVAVTDFFVLQNYRGIGIGSQLLQQAVDSLKSAGVRWILIANIFIPQSMESLVTRMGFEKLGSGYVKDLFQGA